MTNLIAASTYMNEHNIGFYNVLASRYKRGKLELDAINSAPSGRPAYM
jgi:hypothetical protein